VIDDILDTGRTLRCVTKQLAVHQPRSLRTCVLLRKPAKAPPDVRADFVGFDIEDRFVVGYGLDFNGLYRNYPHLAVLRPELYTADAHG
jgi:hypoxanthine phosphoribosyltransferase